MDMTRPAHSNNGVKERPSGKTASSKARGGRAAVTSAPRPAHHLPRDPSGLGEVTVYTGDCREVLPQIPQVKAGAIDLIFADPPFNWARAYDEWDDDIPDHEYLRFTYDWLDLCIGALKPSGAIWVNIPDTWAAEIVVHLKQRKLHMINWCVWHYRFGQNTTARFINSKVHALYFARSVKKRTFNAPEILEPSDRATTYADPRTHNKKEGVAGMRLPLDVWYGKNWGRIQGNNRERRANHDNQIPEVYLERVVRACSNPGDLVLDPFLGSGTTCTVARALHRDSIGVEYSKANAKSAFERVAKGALRVKFDAPTRHVSAIFEPRGPGSRTRPGATRAAD